MRNTGPTSLVKDGNKLLPADIELLVANGTKINCLGILSIPCFIDDDVLIQLQFYVSDDVDQVLLSCQALRAC